MKRYDRWLKVTLPAVALLWAACDLSVSNPGPLPDEDLNTPEAMPGLVIGMSADLSVAVGEITRATSVMTDELTHSGNYSNEGLFYRGIIEPENVNGLWNDMQRARWVTEHGIERMQEVLGSDFEGNELSARAYILAGYANRLLGENVCNAVIDGGPSQDYTVHFERAEQQFGEALRIAQDADDTDLIAAARAGRASVRVALGDWAGAVDDAEEVPVDFVYNAVFSTNTSREENTLAYETQDRREFTVFNTPWAAVHDDPRVPWDSVFTSSGAPQTGQDGRTTFFRQAKYPNRGADIPLSKGTEMLLIQAEAELRGGDYDRAMELVSDARAHYGLAPVSAANEAEAWTILQSERGADLWLEARRLGDLRRWHAEGLVGEWKDAGHDKCIPISLNEEASNPNL